MPYKNQLFCGYKNHTLDGLALAGSHLVAFAATMNIHTINIYKKYKTLIQNQGEC
jgi:hypothetical protein